MNTPELINDLEKFAAELEAEADKVQEEKTAALAAPPAPNPGTELIANMAKALGVK